MAASVGAAVVGVLTAAFAAANAALPNSASNPDRISVYRSLTGVPTNRYAVVYAGGPMRGTSGLSLLGRDGVGRFQVTCAATSPDAGQAAAVLDWLANATLNALVGAELTVDGWSPFVVEQDEVDTFPVSVEVVPGRDTVEQALLFRYLTDRII